MMNREVDARGLACPKPVIQTKKAIEEIKEGVITTIVDNVVAKENISKFAKSLNLHFNIREENELYYIDIYKNELIWGQTGKSILQLEPCSGGWLGTVGREVCFSGTAGRVVYSKD